MQAALLKFTPASDRNGRYQGTKPRNQIGSRGHSLRTKTRDSEVFVKAAQAPTLRRISRPSLPSIG